VFRYIYHSMKILVSIYSLHRGGAERVVSRLSQEWAKEHDVVIALSSMKDIVYPYGGRIVDMGCEAYTPLAKALAIFKRVLRLIQILKREQPDKIITFMEGTNIPAIVASAMTGTREKLTISVRTNPMQVRRMYAILARLFYAHVPDVVVVSQGVQEAMEHVWGIHNNVRVIHNPIDGEEIEEKKKEARVLECCVGDNTIVAVGRLEKVKGFDVLIESFKKVFDENNSATLCILGEGPERDHLRLLAKGLGIEDHVWLPGFVDNPYAYFSRASVYVLSSRMEGMPNALIEAMASRVPVVSTDCPYGPGELIASGENGFLVPVEDVDALAQGIMTVMTMSYEDRQKMAEKAWQRVQGHRIAAIGQQWLR
jgi:GalNAc-alpha-(1->4)-GalNAc-alpha-(1->3)-diNAcBac-PP-undecaprenol alpha-1,4-N-acetyl-D-galactosaminyltransferase